MVGRAAGSLSGGVAEPEVALRAIVSLWTRHRAPGSQDFATRQDEIERGVAPGVRKPPRLTKG